MANGVIVKKVLVALLALIGAVLAFVTLSGREWATGKVSALSAHSTGHFGIDSYEIRGDLGDLHSVDEGHIQWCFDDKTEPDADKLQIGDGKEDCNKARVVRACAALAGVLSLVAFLLVVIPSIASRWASVPTLMAAIFMGIALGYYPKKDVCRAYESLAGVPLVTTSCDWGHWQAASIASIVLLVLSGVLAASLPPADEPRGKQGDRPHYLTIPA